MKHYAELRREGRLSYRRDGRISAAQSWLKHSLVPMAELDRDLPTEGTIYDFGCGEGILANMVARLRPDCEIVGIDIDQDRVDIANSCAASNAKFQTGDFLTVSVEATAAAIILNDVVHHHPVTRHRYILGLALETLKPDGVLLLKEVDRGDRADEKMTRFFDSRLYPDDPPSFRGREDWLLLLKRLGCEGVAHQRLRHFWPASRTYFTVQRPREMRSPKEIASTIAARNRGARQDGKVTVFMTGATGFIGGHLCRDLITAGMEGKPVRLVYLDRNPGRSVPFLDAGGTAGPMAGTECEALPGDLADLNVLSDALEGIEYVFHLAAEVKLTGGKDLWRNNLEGTRTLIDALSGKAVKRLIFASTIGAVDRAPDDDCSRPLMESDPPHPLSEYGRTKLQAEELVRASGLPHAVLRVTWGYGRGMTPDTHVWFLTDGAARQKFFSRFDFPGRVSIVSAHDLVRAFRLVATSDAATNRVFFVSDGNPVALGDLFREYRSLVGKECFMLPIPGVLQGLARRLRRYLPFQLQCLMTDVLTAAPTQLAALGFEPALGRREGLMRLAAAQGYLAPETVTGDSARPISVVTGAAAGIGRDVARILYEKGHRLLLIDNDASALTVTAGELSAETLVFDVGDADLIGQLEQRLARGNNYLDWVINNAGIGIRGRFDELDQTRHDTMLRVNCLGVVRLSHLAIRQFKARNRGVLVNVGSSAAFQPLPYMSAYAASKAFVQSFTLGLYGEMESKDRYRVCVFHPSGTDTGFQDRAGVRKDPNEKLLSSRAVAEALVRAGERYTPASSKGFSVKMVGLLSRCLPRAIQARLWARLMQARR